MPTRTFDGDIFLIPVWNIYFCSGPFGSFKSILISNRKRNSKLVLYFEDNWKRNNLQIIRFKQNYASELKAFSLLAPFLFHLQIPEQAILNFRVHIFSSKQCFWRTVMFLRCVSLFCVNLLKFYLNLFLSQIFIYLLCLMCLYHIIHIII